MVSSYTHPIIIMSAYVVEVVVVSLVVNNTASSTDNRQFNAARRLDLT